MRRAFGYFLRYQKRQTAHCRRRRHTYVYRGGPHRPPRPSGQKIAHGAFAQRPSGARYPLIYARRRFGDHSTYQNAVRNVVRHSGTAHRNVYAGLHAHAKSAAHYPCPPPHRLLRNVFARRRTFCRLSQTHQCDAARQRRVHVYELSHQPQPRGATVGFSPYHAKFVRRRIRPRLCRGVCRRVLFTDDAPFPLQRRDHILGHRRIRIHYAERRFQHGFEHYAPKEKSRYERIDPRQNGSGLRRSGGTAYPNERTAACL